MSDLIIIGYPDGTMVRPGTSAILAIGRKAAPDRVLEALRQYGGTVLQTSLTPDAERQPTKTLHLDDPAVPTWKQPATSAERSGQLPSGARR